MTVLPLPAPLGRCLSAALRLLLLTVAGLVLIAAALA